MKLFLKVADINVNETSAKNAYLYLGIMTGMKINAYTLMIVSLSNDNRDR